jgi:hypothetical protein
MFLLVLSLLVLAPKSLYVDNPATETEEVVDNNLFANIPHYNQMITHKKPLSKRIFYANIKIMSEIKKQLDASTLNFDNWKILKAPSNQLPKPEVPTFTIPGTSLELPQATYTHAVGSAFNPGIGVGLEVASGRAFIVPRNPVL